MKFIYPAQICQYSEDEVVVSFRDVPHCHTSGEDVAEALLEAEDALEEAIAGHINRGESIPVPSAPFLDEYLVPLSVGTAAKAALTITFRASGLTRVELANQLGVHDRVVRRMLDPSHGTSVNRINDALRVLGKQVVIEMQESAAGSPTGPHQVGSNGGEVKSSIGIVRSERRAKGPCGKASKPVARQSWTTLDCQLYIPSDKLD